MKRFFQPVLFIATALLAAITATQARAQGASDPYVAAMMMEQRAQAAAAAAAATALPDAAAPETAAAAEDCAPAPFGQSLFEGGDRSGRMLMSPKQRIVPGDRIAISIWGAMEAQETATVDSQGYIFLPGIGPVKVEGKTEEQLSAHLQSRIAQVFKDDTRVYARLEQSTGTPVLVTGGVARPGQYYGSTEDSVITWLNRAGGILPREGSYRNIRILRDGATAQTVDLYPFLQNGIIPPFAFAPGDVIVVGRPWMQVAATGDVRRCAVFELPSGAMGGALADLAQPRPGATHALLQGFRGNAPSTRVLSLDMLRATIVEDGDAVRFYAAPQDAQIVVNVEGPTQGNRMLTVPQATALSDVLDHIPVEPGVSDVSSVYIRRPSVAALQQRALDESARRLLQAALTAPAKSDGEALIRAKEAELIGEFARVARTIRPEGRVVVMQDGRLNDISLEQGDTIVIPRKTDVVSIEGEVVLPRAIVARPGATAQDYVKMAGGFTERATKTDFIVIRPNGDAVRSGDPDIRAGDRLLVLPRVDTKYMQFAKDMMQILYQAALGAGVLMTIDDK